MWHWTRAITTLAVILVICLYTSSSEPAVNHRQVFSDGRAGAATFALPLFVTEDQRVARDREPASGGIPLPQGAVFDPALLEVRDAAGGAVSCQAHQLGISWPDGSLRWALVQFPATVGAGETARYTLGVRQGGPGGIAPPGGAALRVDDRGTHVEVTTGPMKFRVDREGFALPNRVWIDDGGQFDDEHLVLRDGPRLGLIADREAMTDEEFRATGEPPGALKTFGLADQGGKAWNRITRGVDHAADLAGEAEITIEEAGPVRAVLRIEAAGEKKEGRVGLVARIFAYAGQKFLRIELGLENYERWIPIPDHPQWSAIANAKHVRRFDYVLRPAFGRAERVELGTESGSRVVPGDADARLVQRGDRAQLATARDSMTEAGRRAPGWISVASGQRRVTLASKYFWEVYPKGLAYDARDGAVRLEFWPGDTPAPGYPLAAGRRRTREFVLAVDTPGPQASAMARGELRAYPDAAYVAATGATHRFVPLADPGFPAYAAYVRRCVDRELGRRLYGDIDFGDQESWTPETRWNGYHGASHEWFMIYLASGRPEHFRLAEAAVWHTLDVDTMHWGHSAGARDAEIGRKQDHVWIGPGLSGIKAWNFGEVDYYFLTGKRRVLEVLPKTADFLLKAGGTTPETFTNERGTSLPLMHLAYMYEAIGSEEAVEQLYPGRFPARGGYRFRTDCAGREKSLAWLRRLRAMSEHFAAVYDRKAHARSGFIASYSAEGFYRFWSLTGDPRAARGVVQAADFLYHDLRLPTGNLKYADGPPWEAFGARMPFTDEVELPAARAYQVTGDRKYLDYGKAPVDWNLHYRGISDMPGFGGTIPVYLWALRDAGLTEEALRAMRPDIDYEKALAESREIALSGIDLKPGPSGEARAYCLLAEEVARVLINLGRHDEALEWLARWQGNPNAYDAYLFANRARALKGDPGHAPRAAPP